MNFEQDVINASRKKPVIVDFFAEWCGPCRMIAPRLESLSESAGIDLVKIDVDDNQNKDLIRRYKVMSMPTIVAFKNGNIVSRYPFGGNPSQLSTWISEFNK